MGGNSELCTAYIEPVFNMGCRLESKYENRPGFPRVLYINIHNICNAKCEKCLSGRYKKPEAFMDMELYRRIIDEFASKGGEVVCMCPHSEPFAHLKALEYIRYASLKGLKLYFQTNMRGLNDEILQTMVNFGLDAKFKISFPGIFEETYRKNTDNCLWESLENTKNLKKKYGDICYIHALENNFLPFEKEVVEFYWNFNGIPVICEHPHNWAGQGEAGGKKMLRVGSGCIDLLNGITVNVSGSVLLCPMDINETGKLGDLNTSSISEIWNSSKLQSITEDVYRGSRVEFDILCDACHKVSVKV